MALITCTDLSFGYEGKTVIAGIDFAVNAGDYLVIVGENGSGKTTLMRGLLGLNRPLSGRITFGDGLKQTEIGYLPQQSNAQRDFPASCFEVALSGRLNTRGLRPFYTKQDREIAKKNMELLDVYDLRRKSFRNLSGGQQQRVLLARALCATSRILLLDEPVSGLDPLVTAELYKTIHDLQAKTGITVIMISHDIHAAVAHASHMLHLRGKQLFFGKTADYKASETGQVFLRKEDMG